jgi:hypothetical protein
MTAAESSTGPRAQTFTAIILAVSRQVTKRAAMVTKRYEYFINKLSERFHFIIFFAPKDKKCVL